MAIPLAEISEKTATGEVARIFGEIREATGLPLVNLIFRHMATIPGCLEWAWQYLKPLYMHSAIHEAADAIAMLARPDAGAEFPCRGDETTADTLESYVRGNMLNMIGLFVLTSGAGSKGATGHPFTPRVISKMLPLPDLAALPATAMDRLRALTRQTESDSPIIPSLFRHFATSDEAMTAIERLVSDLSRSGRLEMISTAMMAAGKEAAAKFPAPPSPGDTEISRTVRYLAGLFPPTMARMTILAQAMR